MRRVGRNFLPSRARLNGGQPGIFPHLHGYMVAILDLTNVKGPDYASETSGLFSENETRYRGECRHRRLVLFAWDRMEVGGEFAGMDI